MGSCENIPFHGELQKIRLIANNMGYGPLPAPDEEVEQRLTMTREGKVWLSRYSFHDTMRNIMQHLLSCLYGTGAVCFPSEKLHCPFFICSAKSERNPQILRQRNLQAPEQRLFY